MKISHPIAAAVLAMPLLVNGANILLNGDGEKQLEGWSDRQVLLSGKNPHGGENCFRTAAPTVENSQIIPIDPRGTYRVSAFVRSASSKPSDIYLALIPLDAQKQQIQPEMVTAVPRTDTVLAAPCKAEDKVLKVKDASAFKANDAFNLIAFQTKGDYTDLPNRNLSAGVIKTVAKKEGLWEITLNKPCGRDYPAGTAVREHRYSARFIMPCRLGKFGKKEWTPLSGTVGGLVKSGASSAHFWPGTAFVKVAVLSWNGGVIEFDDLKLEKIK